MEGEQPTIIKEVQPLKSGLSAVVLPELGERDYHGNLRPPTQEVALARLNGFLDELNQQGAKIVSILDLDVNVGRRPGVVGDVTEPRRVAIIHKEQ